MSWTATRMQTLGAALFVLALAHTFGTRWFEHLAHVRPAHAGLWHLLGEVEVVFGFWAMVPVMVLVLARGLVNRLAAWPPPAVLTNAAGLALLAAAFRLLRSSGQVSFSARKASARPCASAALGAW